MNSAMYSFLVIKVSTSLEKKYMFYDFIVKRKFKQGLSMIPPISTQLTKTSHFKSLKTRKNMT
jgi:hypothetical protein